MIFGGGRGAIWKGSEMLVVVMMVMVYWCVDYSVPMMMVYVVLLPFHRWGMIRSSHEIHRFDCSSYSYHH